MRFPQKYLILFLLTAAISLVLIFSSALRQLFLGPKTQLVPPSGQVVIDNTLKETPSDLMQFTFDFQIEKATSTIFLSWDEAKIKIFSVMLTDIKEYNLQAEQEKIIVWAMTSVPPEKLPEVAETKLFLASPYIVGEKIDGFFSFKEDRPILEKGKEYWIQLVGLDNNKQVEFTSKIFFFGK